MSDAAALIRRMVEAGTPADIVADVAMALANAAALEQLVEGRRRKDRERAIRRQAELPDDWDHLRVSIFERDGWVCQYCGTTEAEQWHCDHIVPLSRGGSSEERSLTTSCRSCNSSKGDRLVSEWRR